MSHHHILPPIAYTPPPKPKKIETRKRRINIGDAGTIDDMDETGETHEAAGFGQAAQAGNKPPPQKLHPHRGIRTKTAASQGSAQ
jgi:hypothetical protein